MLCFVWIRQGWGIGTDDCQVFLSIGKWASERHEPVTQSFRTCCKWIKINSLYLILYRVVYSTIHVYSGITSGRMLDEELLYTKILEVKLFAFALEKSLCRQMQTY